jgi:hypothetical protein
MKYSAPAIVSTKSASNGLGSKQSALMSVKGDGTPDNLGINSNSAYTANS